MSVFFGLLFAACSEESLLADGAKSEAGGDFADTAAGDGTTDSDTEDTFAPTWFTLRAEATLSAGAAAEGAAVTLVLADAELSSSDCALPAASVAATPAPAEGPALFAWWEVTLTAACVPSGAPGRLGFGIGPLDPEVRARLGTVELEDRAEELYGAWLSPDDLDFFPFGYADGGSFVADAPPDGVYALEPLLVVALD